MVNFKRFEYGKLNSKQKEIYNFQKVSAVLADYGYATYRLIDDWNGADFLAVPFNSSEVLKVQLKSRLAFGHKYKNKDIWICFVNNEQVFLFPHDEIMNEAIKLTNIKNTESWTKPNGGYSFPAIPKVLIEVLNKYCLWQA